MQKLENMQKIMQGINISFAGMNEKFSKLESQSSAPKVVVQKKYGHSYATKLKGVHIYDDGSRSNSSPPSEIHDQKVVHQEKGPEATFLIRKNQFPRPIRFFPRVIYQIPRPK